MPHTFLGKKTIEIIDFDFSLLMLALTLALPFRSIKSVREIGSKFSISLFSSSRSNLPRSELGAMDVFSLLHMLR